MTQKKNSFWRFIFSLLPGAGEMYMGFMKMGISLMTMFFAIIAVSNILGLDVLGFLAVIEWFYSFFHVHNLAGMPDEEFYAVEDEYLFKLDEWKLPEKEFIQTYRNAIAIVLIVIGGAMTWKGMYHMLDEYIPERIFWFIHDIAYRLPQVVVGIAIIVLGIRMIRGKKQQLDQMKTTESTNKKIEVDEDRRE